jgi:hypothetical protein
MSGYDEVSDVSGGGFGYGYLRSATETHIHNQLIDCSIGVPINIQYADKYAEVEYGYLSGLIEQTSLANNISRTSPVSLYENVMSSLAGTDMASIRHFIDGVKLYRKDIIEYMSSRTNNFSSSTFFTPCTKEEIKTRPRTDDAEPLDLSDLPRFSYRADLAGTLRRVVPDLAILIFGNILFFALASVAFLKYDVR